MLEQQQPRSKACLTAPDLISDLGCRRWLIPESSDRQAGRPVLAQSQGESGRSFPSSSAFLSAETWTWMLFSWTTSGRTWVISSTLLTTSPFARQAHHDVGARLQTVQYPSRVSFSIGSGCGGTS